MSSAHPNINYAQFSGIESVAGAIIFAILYVPLCGWFFRQSIARPTYVFVILCFFCATRISAFVIRSVLAASETAGHSLNLLIAEQIVFSIGFFGILYSAYTLVLDRELLSDAPPATGIISRITRNRLLFRLALVAGITVGITGSINAALSTSNSGIALGKTLRKASVIIFLVLTILQAYQTLVLLRIENRFRSYQPTNKGWGMQHGIYILCIISLLLLVREAFLAATLGNTAKQNNEHFWYPLVALPEVIAVILYATPGLVPPRSELPT